ncbi:nagb/rpia/CoA transferase-like protein [Sphaerulina musiva SO2202]|uniref:Translation initiation factor eIF2B subunit alpha n=1 Tax=Sphaerulina musiva (strain SO2202) TaxID=692275 RepID=N1QGC5_SPHMS|nr:nagb/rpia/CoA transferase-like protein [Sphaerulina musiva SO2202]EMF09593.1 nagb/rpia/CoA transferase-like protein [Sphaerulina musiva SO2202]
MPSAAPPDEDAPFDIVSTYHRLLASDPDLTMPVAAIESLILGLAAHPSTTVSETLDSVQNLTKQLKDSIPNSLSLSAGTDIFQQYLISNLNRPNHSSAITSIPEIHKHLVQNGKLFVQRAKAAREEIAKFGKLFLKDGDTILTSGGSRVVGSFLKAAASDPSLSLSPIEFRVIYVLDNHPTTASESANNISALRSMGIPVATIPPTAIAYAMNQVTAVFVGAEGVVENGGIISRMGTYQMGLLARAAAQQKPFYVLAERHKFVRLYPLRQKGLGVTQKVMDFKIVNGEGEEVSCEEEDGKEEKEGQEREDCLQVEDSVDYTPPELISGIITETGVMLPSAVSEELIKIWF